MKRTNIYNNNQKKIKIILFKITYKIIKLNNNKKK